MEAVSLLSRRPRENGTKACKGVERQFCMAGEANSLASSMFFKKKRHWMPIFMGMTILMMCSSAFALETPHSGRLDHRVKHINYNPHQVVKLVGHYGFSTDIEFGKSESVTQVAMGDSEAWTVIPVANHIFIKPKAQKAVTNMTVLTASSHGNHVYNFELNAHWSRNGAHPYPNDMMFQIQFIYPNETLASQQRQALKSELEANSKPKIANQNYWYKGDESLLPISVFDDGRFTYLTFNRNQDLPAVYMVNADDSESLVNSNINPEQPDTIVIRRVAKHLVLRQGEQVLCLFNRSFATETTAPYATTTLQNVTRRLKAQGGK